MKPLATIVLAASMVAGAVLAALTVTQAKAAAIYATHPLLSDHAIVKISGEIAPGDEITFAQVTAGLPAGTAISLNSPGGEVPAAIAIARMVRKRGYVGQAMLTKAEVEEELGYLLMSNDVLVTEFVEEDIRKSSCKLMGLSRPIEPH